MARSALPRRLNWQLADVTGLVDESPRTRTIELEADDWPGHLPG